MMKRNTLAYIFAGLLLASCNSWLDIDPKMQVDRDEVYTSEDGYKDVLSGCYAMLKSDDLYGKTLAWESVEYMAQHWVTGSTGTNYAFRQFNYQDEYVKSVFKNIYSKLYTVIAQANDMLRYMDQQGMEVIHSEKTLMRLKGEALAIRAFCHFELLRIFGEVPTAGATIHVSLPYAEIASEYRVPAYDYQTYTAKVLQDLMEAETLLGESDPVTEYTFAELNDPVKLDIKADDAFRRLKFNYWAVKALKARFYLYTGETELAYNTAMEVINAKVHDEPVLELSIAEDIANRAYTLPSETLLAMHVFELDKKAEVAFEGDNALSAAETRDRLMEDVFHNESSDSRMQLFADQVLTGGGGRVLIVLKKYIQDDSGLGLEGNQSVGAADNFVTMQMVPLVRLAEMYLIAAECAPDLAEANRIMRIYKGNRNIEHQDYISFASMESDILNQYQREFWGEGQMFYAYKRKMSKDIMWSVVPPVEQSYVVPLPDGEF